MKRYPLLFTVCFLTSGDDVLMLHRKRPPNQGKWNGVGGHIEMDETPYQSALREIYEETGLALPALSFGGILTWEGFEIQSGGLYIFYEEVKDRAVQANGEGNLAWQPKSFAFSDDRVVDNIHIFLPPVLQKADPVHYHFDYQNGVMIAHSIQPLPDWVDIHRVKA